MASLLAVGTCACVTSSNLMMAKAPRELDAGALSTPDLTCRVKDKAGHLVRSDSRRARFVKMTGGERAGMVVNHIVPLRCGGCDVPSNMEWMTVADWKARTGPERRDCGRHAGGSW
jgi:hypothetical protein